MIIPIAIGKNSNGEAHLIDLSTIPLLMISYSNETQVSDFLNKLLNTNHEHRASNYVMMSSRNRVKLKYNDDNLFYLKDVPDQGEFKSKTEFLTAVNKEIRQRIKILTDKKIKDFNRYVSLNLWNKQKLTYQFMVVDDVWDLVISKPNSIGLLLMNIILNGPYAGIHTILISGISYRNLLQQLIQMNPTIKQQLQKKFGIPEPMQISNMGTEIIFTPDELIFLRKAKEMEMQRFFK